MQQRLMEQWGDFAGNGRQRYENTPRRPKKAHRQARVDGFNEDLNNVTYTLLDLSQIPTERQPRIMQYAETIRREQLIELGHNVYSDTPASAKAVREFWNSSERTNIPNWPSWLVPPSWMLED